MWRKEEQEAKESLDYYCRCVLLLSISVDQKAIMAIIVNVQQLLFATQPNPLEKK